MDPTPEPQERPVDPAASAAPETGVPAVDRALEALQAAGDRPIGEQVPVFEDTHRRLRAALDDPDIATAGDGADPAEA